MLDERKIRAIIIGPPKCNTAMAAWMGQRGQALVEIADADAGADCNHHLIEALVVYAFVMRIVRPNAYCCENAHYVFLRGRVCFVAEHSGVR